MMFLIFFSAFPVEVEFTPLEMGYTPLFIYKDAPVFPPIFLGVPLWEPPIPFDPYSFPLLSSYSICKIEGTFSLRNIHLNFGTSVLYSQMLVPYYLPFILYISKKIRKQKVLYITCAFSLFKTKESLKFPLWRPIKSGGGICFYDKMGYLRLEIGMKVVPSAYWGKAGYVNGFYLEIIAGFKWRTK